MKPMMTSKSPTKARWKRNLNALLAGNCIRMNGRKPNCFSELILVRQFEAHLKGKKHLRAVLALRKEMQEEDEILCAYDDEAAQGIVTPDLRSLQSLPKGVEPTSLTAEDGNASELGPAMSDEDQRPSVTRNDVQVDVITLQSDSLSDVGIHSPKAKLGREDGEIDTDAELDQEISKLFLGRGKKEHVQTTNDSKAKIGAAKAKRRKRAEKQAALEAEGRTAQKPNKQRKPYDPSAAVQKARGETVTTGRRSSKK